MWVFVWVVFAIFILGVFAWSLQILIEQKKSWKSFAKRYGMTVTEGKVMDSLILQGKISGYNAMIYSQDQPTSDGRGQKFVTVVELALGQPLPTGGVIGAASFAPLVSTLVFAETYVVDLPEWDKTRLLKARDAVKMNKYLTKDRLQALHEVMVMKNSVALYFFDERDGVLRIETPDPLRDLERMDRIVKRLVAVMEKLKLTDAEKAEFLPAPQSA